MKFRILPLLPLLAVTIGLASPAGADEPRFALVGQDEKGNPVETSLSPGEYGERLLASMALVQESALAAVARRPADPAWQLRTVIVGVSVSGEIGIGPILKLKATPSFKLAFSNSEDPALP